MKRSPPLLLLLATTLVVGCTGRDVALNIRIASNQDPFTDIDALELLAVDARDGRVVALRRFSPSASRLALPSIPFGEARVFVLRGVVETPAGDVVVSGGKSCPVPVLEGATGLEVPLYFARARAFASLADGGTGGSFGGDLALPLAGGARVLLAGDAGGSGAFLYDHDSGELIPFADGTVDRSGSAAVALPEEGGWLVLGGTTGTGAVTDDALLLDQDGRVVASTGAMVDARSEHTATLLADGRVLVIGGHDGATTLTAAEVAGVEPTLEPFLAHGELVLPRRRHTATPVSLGPNTTVFVFGGDREPPGSGVVPLATAEKLNPLASAAMAFVPVGGAMTDARTGHTATALEDGAILVVGGRGVSGPLRSAELFDPFAESFRVVELLPEMREAHTATLLESGRVLIVGGTDTSGSPLASAELYIPESESFVPTGASTGMVAARAGHVATRLCDGTVLVAGGTGAGPAVEIYSPAPDF